MMAINSYAMGMMIRVFEAIVPKRLTKRGAELLQTLADITTGEATETMILFHNGDYIPSPFWNVSDIAETLTDMVNDTTAQAAMIQYLANMD